MSCHLTQLGGDYLERLWTDFQIVLYSRYIEEILGTPLAGVLYNVLVKARLSQSRGETESEYEARRAALIAKSKTGRTTAKRKLPTVLGTALPHLPRTVSRSCRPSSGS